MSKSDPTIYDELKAAGVPLDSHESDLYAKVTDISREIMLRRPVTDPIRRNVRVFVSQIDERLWYDIPFAYTPWWERCALLDTLKGA